mgnify:CR=1 FL=1
MLGFFRRKKEEEEEEEEKPKCKCAVCGMEVEYPIYLNEFGHLCRNCFGRVQLTAYLYARLRIKKLMGEVKPEKYVETLRLNYGIDELSVTTHSFEDAVKILKFYNEHGHPYALVFSNNLPYIFEIASLTNGFTKLRIYVQPPNILKKIRRFYDETGMLLKEGMHYEEAVRLLKNVFKDEL